MAAVDREEVSGSLRVGRVAAPLREQATAVLREAILDSRLRPGQRLVERELIEQTGVSRATIREALRQLTAEGLVTVVPQRGAIVVELTAKEVKDLYEVRAALESLAARLFAERATDAQLGELREAVDALREAVAHPDARRQPMQAIIAVKDRYYEVLMRGCGNDEITTVFGTLQARVRRMRAATLGQHGRAQETLAEIEQVLSAIVRRDASAAAHLSQVHVERAGAIALRGVEQAEAAAALGVPAG